MTGKIQGILRWMISGIPAKFRPHIVEIQCKFLKLTLMATSHRMSDEPKTHSLVLHFPQQTVVISDKYTYQKLSNTHDYFRHLKLRLWSIID